MKKIILLAILLLISTGCSITVTHKMMVGEEFALIVPEKIAFSKTPSADGETFFAWKPVSFVIEGVECGQGKKDGECILDLDENKRLKDVKTVFYKIKLENCIPGYIAGDYFFDPDSLKYFIDIGPKYQIGYAARQTNYFDVKTSYDRMWRVVRNSIDELGYVMSQMDKEDGYMTTNIKNDGDTRSKLSVWLSKHGEYIEVTVGARSEHLFKTQQYKRWEPDGWAFQYKERLLDKIKWKFFELHRMDEAAQ
ncbi:MAG: outer membrane protein assembly factor BamC [Deltaproteobacteria bacterium]|nr:outer membrane protein assembly factor BamC [Deltaproteobacteria bacterium]